MLLWAICKVSVRVLSVSNGQDDIIGYGVTANIAASHAAARGSIPRIRIVFALRLEANRLCTSAILDLRTMCVGVDNCRYGIVQTHGRSGRCRAVPALTADLRRGSRVCKCDYPQKGSFQRGANRKDQSHWLQKDAWGVDVTSRDPVCTWD